MTFDDERYAREVLEPARLADSQPPADLLVRYSLSPPLDPAQVAATLPAVLGCWRRVRRELKYRKLVSRLEADHARLAPAFDRARAGDLGPLVAAIEQARSASDGRLERLRREIEDIAGPVGRITPGLLSELAANHGLRADDVAPLCAAAGVAVATPDPLPPEPPVSGYPRYREALRTLGCRHTADFLGSSPVLWGGVVDAGTVSTVDQQWAARPHDGSRTLASTVLVALKALAPAEIVELVRYEVAEELRARHLQGASAAGLVEYAVTGLGLQPDDARRVVFAVRAGSAVPAPEVVAPAPGGPLSATPPATPTLAPLAAFAPLPSPQHIAADRAGDEVVVRWEWPPELTEVLLRWQLGSQPWRERSVSRGAYRSQGGAWLPVASVSSNGDRNAPLQVVLVPVATRHGRRVEGAPLTVRVPGRVEAWYEVTRTGPPWRRELTVAVRTGQPAQLRRLMVVLRRGTVMPLHATDGEVLRQLDDVRLAPDRPLTLRLPVPRGPYWLRCFTADDDDVELRDPPVVQLRGR